VTDSPPRHDPLDLGPFTLDERQRQICAEAVCRMAEDLARRIACGCSDEVSAEEVLTLTALNVELNDLGARLNGTDRDPGFLAARETVMARIRERSQS